MNPRFQNQTLRVHQDMALSAFHLLSSVVTSPIPSHTGALDRLAIHHACARLRVPLQADPQTLAQGGVHPLPGAVEPPRSEIMVNGLPGWEVVGQQSPGTATTQDVENGVEDLAQGVHPGTSWGFGGRHMGLYVGPLGIGEVGLICFSHARYSTEPLSQDPFSDSFSSTTSLVSARTEGLDPIGF